MLTCTQTDNMNVMNAPNIGIPQNEWSDILHHIFSSANHIVLGGRDSGCIAVIISFQVYPMSISYLHYYTKKSIYLRGILCPGFLNAHTHLYIYIYVYTYTVYIHVCMMSFFCWLLTYVPLVEHKPTSTPKWRPRVVRSMSPIWPMSGADLVDGWCNDDRDFITIH